jgi:hypothetical protein
LPNSITSAPQDRSNPSFRGPTTSLRRAGTLARLIVEQGEQRLALAHLNRHLRSVERVMVEGEGACLRDGRGTRFHGAPFVAAVVMDSP